MSPAEPTGPAPGLCWNGPLRSSRLASLPPSAPGPPQAGPARRWQLILISARAKHNEENRLLSKTPCAVLQTPWEAQRGPGNAEGEGRSELTNPEPLPGFGWPWAGAATALQTPAQNPVLCAA
uniref:Uncharacterized protein n=1 Tax=Pipistrellus kuhlii TaxID=59472 RepID=A0A7J7VBG0_PIPKU|nr:hypothetical protein mPipKuh1_008533 [Pipistrellus kuhlii]